MLPTQFSTAVSALRPDLPHPVQNDFVAGGGAQELTQVVPIERVQTQIPYAIGCQAAAVAMSAEGGSDRGDNPEGSSVRQAVAFGRSCSGCGHGFDGAKMLAQPPQNFLPRHYLGERPAGGPAHIHVFDEAD